MSEPAVTITLGGTGFTQKSVSVPAGQAVRLTLKNVAGTNAGKLSFESTDMGIQPITLGPGQSQEVRWTSPAQATELKAKTPKGPNTTLTVSVKPAESRPVAAQAAISGPQGVNIGTHNIAFDITTLTVKAGEPVRFVFANGDDEKHNLVGIGEGLNLLSPDVPGGQTVTYDWTAPSTPGKYTVICAYHPHMTFSLEIQ